jgi:hypothetical protein
MAMRNSATWRHILPSAWIAEPGLIPSIRHARLRRQAGAELPTDAMVKA